MASKSRIATAYVQLVPTTHGFFNSLNTQVGQAARDTGSNFGAKFAGAVGLTKMFRGAGWVGLIATGALAAVKIGSSIFSGIKTAISTIGSVIKDLISGAINGVAGIITNVLSGAVELGLSGISTIVNAGLQSISKIGEMGLDRVLTIEDAEAKLAALKYNAESIKGITKSAMDSVLGTTYSFDQAMKISVQGLAAGIKEGDGLTSYLKLISDAATVSGADLNEMGYIFNKIQANGRVFAQENNMAMDRGLPSTKWMADEMKVTAQEFRKLMKAGKVDSSVFFNAIQKNIGGAATTAATTTRGYLANAKYALARMGAVLTGGGVPIFRDMLIKTIPVIDGITKKLTPVFQDLWKLIDSKITPAFDNLLKTIANGNMDFNTGPIGFIWDGLKGIYGHIKSIISIVPELWSRMTESPLGQMFGDAIGDAVNFISHLRPIGEIFTEVILPAIMPIIDLATSLFPIVIDAFKNLGSVIAENYLSWGESLGGFFASVTNFFQTHGPLIGEFLKSAMFGASEIFNNIFTNMTDLVNWFTEKMSESGPSLLESFQNVLPGILDLLDSLKETAIIIGDVLIPLIESMNKHIGPALSFTGGAIKDGTMMGAANFTNAKNFYGNIAEFTKSKMRNEAPDYAPVQIGYYKNTYPKMATGGNVAFRPGGTTLTVGEKAPETISDRGLTNRNLAENTKLAMKAQKAVESSYAPIYDYRSFNIDNGNNIDPKVLAREIYKLDKKGLRG